MATTIKRIKLIEDPTWQALPRLEQSHDWNALPIELWLRIAHFTPSKELNSFYWLSKNLSIVPDFCNYDLKITTGKKSLKTPSQVCVENSHFGGRIKLSVEHACRIFEKNQVRSLNIEWNEKNLPKKIVSSLAGNDSLRTLAIQTNLSHETENKNNRKCNNILKYTLKIISQKKLLEQFKFELFQYKYENSTLINDNSLLLSILNTLETLPLKTLKLDIETEKGKISSSLGPHLQNLKQLQHLEINDVLTSTFWNGLKNHPTITTLHFPYFEIDKKDNEEDEKIVTNAISTLPRLESFNIIEPDPDSPLVKYCITALANSLPAKLHTFKMRFLGFLSLSHYHVPEEIRRKFFNNIANSKSKITDLEIQDPYVFDYLSDAPWKRVRTAIKKRDLHKLEALNKRKGEISLIIDYNQSLKEINSLLSENIFKDYTKKSNNLETEVFYQIFLSKDAKKKIVISAHTQEQE